MLSLARDAAAAIRHTYAVFAAASIHMRRRHADVTLLLLMALRHDVYAMLTLICRYDMLAAICCCRIVDAAPQRYAMRHIMMPKYADMLLVSCCCCYLFRRAAAFARLMPPLFCRGVALSISRFTPSRHAVF